MNKYPNSSREKRLSAILAGNAPQSKYAKASNPPASEAGYSVGDKVYVIDRMNGSVRKFEGVVTHVLETYLRVKYIRNNVHYLNRYLPTRLERRDE